MQNVVSMDPLLQGANVLIDLKFPMEGNEDLAIYTMGLMMGIYHRKQYNSVFLS